MRNNYKKGLESKQRIIDAAIKLSEQFGYDNLNIRDICKEAGVTTGSFYHHFKQKSDLMSEICRNSAGHFIPVIRTVMEGKPAVEQLETYAFYYAKLNDYTGLEQLKIMYRPENHWFQTRREMEDVLESIIAGGQARGEIIPAPSAREISDYLYTLMRGCCLTWLMFDCSYDLSEKTILYMRYAIQSFLRKPAEAAGPVQ